MPARPFAYMHWTIYYPSCPSWPQITYIFSTTCASIVDFPLQSQVRAQRLNCRSNSISNCQVGLCCAASLALKDMLYGRDCCYRCIYHTIDQFSLISMRQVFTHQHIAAQPIISKSHGISNVLRFIPFLSQWWRTSNFFTRWKITLLAFIWYLGWLVYRVFLLSDSARREPHEDLVQI